MQKCNSSYVHKTLEAAKYYNKKCHNARINNQNKRLMSKNSISNCNKTHFANWRFFTNLGNEEY